APLSAMIHRQVLLTILVLLASFAHGSVTFDQSELIDGSDFRFGTEIYFNCPDGCRVYTPSPETEVSVVSTLTPHTSLYTLAQVNKAPPSNPTTLPGGSYMLKCTACFTIPEFTFFVVQKAAPDYNTPVYTTMGKVGVQNTRYLTFLSDLPGFLIKDISGDLSKGNVSVFTSGGDSVLNQACRPVFVARSTDDAAKSSIGIRGPLATIDFGSDKAVHYATFSPDYTTINAVVGASSVFTSPGYVGCGVEELYTSNYIVNINQNFKVADQKGVCVRLEGVYVTASEFSAVTFTVNDQTLKLFGMGTINQYFNGTTVNIGVQWMKAQFDTTQFAFQVDTMPMSYC
ncbi:hypothetical protein PFISCL1PPCAC_3187, partial [Pristionchus fissidentatus]